MYMRVANLQRRSLPLDLVQTRCETSSVVFANYDLLLKCIEPVVYYRLAHDNVAPPSRKSGGPDRYRFDISRPSHSHFKGNSLCVSVQEDRELLYWFKPGTDPILQQRNAREYFDMLIQPENFPRGEP